ncbi:MAG: hypothetical protein HYS59_01550 [Candidatus Vogelbacteria bacterium]|nr:hypothetical protein [Candidatus Vogelbacteria bacterium]
MEHNKEHNNAMAGAIIVSLLVGGGIGYYIGIQGAGTLSVSDAAIVDDETVAAEIAQSANPFAQTTENPVDTGYVNPFKSTVNPFAQ